MIEAKPESVQKLISCAKERAGYGEVKMSHCYQRLDTLYLAEKSFTYHKECYKDTTNLTNIRRSKQRYEKTSSKLSEETEETKECETPSAKCEVPQKISTRRSSDSHYNKDLMCFLPERRRRRIKWHTSQLDQRWLMWLRN